MNAKRVAAIGWMIVVLFTIPTSSIAHEGKSPGFDAAWAEVTKDGRLLYHCLVDLENCEADQLDLVMQFLYAGLDDSNVKERGTYEPLMLFPQTWQRSEVAQENSRRWKPKPVELRPSLFAGG